MANPTTNYNFAMPTNSDLVKDLPADFEVFGQAVDTQMKTNADAAVVKSTFTTKGDLIAATGASTPARLGVGTNNQVLVADSTAATGLKWATPASGGITQLATGTLSGTAVNITSISGTYKNLILSIEGARTLVSQDGFIRFNNLTTNIYSRTGTRSDNTGVQNQNNATNLYGLNLNAQTAANAETSTLIMYNYTNTTNKTGLWITSDSTNRTYSYGVSVAITTAITEINIGAFVTTWNGGTYTLWGQS